jgi:hypothetical protein
MRIPLPKLRLQRPCAPRIVPHATPAGASQAAAPAAILSAATQSLGAAAASSRFQLRPALNVVRRPPAGPLPLRANKASVRISPRTAPQMVWGGKDYLIAPSILSADFAKLGEEVDNVSALHHPCAHEQRAFLGCCWVGRVKGFELAAAWGKQKGAGTRLCCPCELIPCAGMRGALCRFWRPALTSYTST